MSGDREREREKKKDRRLLQQIRAWMNPSQSFVFALRPCFQVVGVTGVC